MATNVELERQVSALRAELETVKQSTGAAAVEELKAEIAELRRALDHVFGDVAFSFEVRKAWSKAKRGEVKDVDALMPRGLAPISSSLPGLPPNMTP